MIHHTTARLLLGTATIAIATIATPAFAAPTPAAPAAETGPAEIIVTAQRRAERVTDVPISITVADSAQLERQQVDTVSDLGRIAPSLEINNAPGQNTGGGGAIRGIGTQTFSAGAVPSVGVVVDQVSQGNANIANLLRMRTELSGAGIAGSQFGNQIMQGVVNLPIAANAALRISGFANLRQGPDYDVTTHQYDANDSFGFRGHLRWEPSSAVSINLIGDYSRTRITNGGDFFTFVATSGPGLLPLPTPFPIPDNVTGNLASCGVTPGVGNRNYCMANSFVDHTYNGGVSLEIDYKAPAFTLTSISAYRHSLESGFGAATSVFRGDPLELLVNNGPVWHPIDLATEELRFSSAGKQTVEYTAGVFLSSQIQSIAPETLGVIIHPAPPVFIPVANGGTGGYRVTDTSAAAFGQVTVHAADKLRLIVGGRYTQDNLHLTTYAGAIPGSANSHTELNVGKFSWKVGAQYDVAPRTMAYATVSRGFKGGQISQPSGAAPYAILPEIPTSYELGLKSTLFGAWVLDANLFYQKVQNFQAQSCASITSGPLAGTLSCIQGNIDGVKSRGAEINLYGKVTRNLSLNTGLIWARATYPAGFLGSDGSNLGGQQLAYAPEYKFTLSGEYTVPLSQSANAFLAADTIWKSRVSYEQTSVQASTFGAHWTVGGRIGVRTSDDRFTVAVFARNLGNVHEPILMQSGFPYGGGANIGAMYGPNGFRQIGLSLDGNDGPGVFHAKGLIMPSLSRRSFNRMFAAGAGALCAGGWALPAFTADTADARLLDHVDPELRAAVSQIVAEEANAPPMSDATLPALRKGMERWTRPQRPAIPVIEQRIALANAPDVALQVINARAGTARPAILHTHGGGFVVGSARGDIAALQDLANDLDCVIVSVEYRLAPETRWQGSIEDNYAGLKWLHAHAAELGADPARIAVMGESAGGGHAALLAITARDRGEIPVIFQCLVYPMLDDRTGSTREVAWPIGQVLWTAPKNRYGWRSFLGQEPGSATVPDGAVPARVKQAGGLPPAFIAVGSIDLFVDEDIAFAQRLIDAGVPVEMSVIAGAVHGFDRLVPESAIARQFRQSRLDALRRGFARA
eukprot:gene6413-6479_t